MALKLLPHRKSGGRSKEHSLGDGRLPAALQELVPQYIETVPIDPFNDKPMRWNASLQSVYSRRPE